MAIRFTARQMSGGSGHQHIAQLAWIEDGTTETKVSTRSELVDFVNRGGQGYVRDATGRQAWVRVVNATPPYLQTYADNVPTDNLLTLPLF